ncbi:MAG TPA: glycosyltransferase [Ignavibacteriaceae bacterium]|nr:glycosyltransferase [Ignavibacteriaceae bacterium]
MNLKPSIAAATILYNPDNNVLKNINIYKDQVSFIYIIDNSLIVNNSLVDILKTMENVEVIQNSGNFGISAALNKAAQKSISKGYDFLLTMDQDSEASPCMITQLIDKLTQLNNPGIISPLHYNINYKSIESKEEIEEVQVVMTSGNLMNLKAYQLVGGFDENLFIDYVDIDMCFKLILNNYKIYKVNSALLEHKEGNLKTVKLFNKTIRPYNHKPIRWYYKIRNFNYIKKKYYGWFPEYFKEEKKRIIRDLIKIILFEKQKFAKLNFVIKGYFDYKKRILGKCPHLVH